MKKIEKKLEKVLEKNQKIIYIQVLTRSQDQVQMEQLFIIRSNKKQTVN